MSLGVHCDEFLNVGGSGVQCSDFLDVEGTLWQYLRQMLMRLGANYHNRYIDVHDDRSRVRNLVCCICFVCGFFFGGGGFGGEILESSDMTKRPSAPFHYTRIIIYMLYVTARQRVNTTSVVVQASLVVTRNEDSQCLKFPWVLCFSVIAFKKAYSQQMVLSYSASPSRKANTINMLTNVPAFEIQAASLKVPWRVRLQVRRNIRPLFQVTSQTALFYDLLTCLFTRLAIAYLTFTFVALELDLCLHGLRWVSFQTNIVLNLIRHCLIYT